MNLKKKFSMIAVSTILIVSGCSKEKPAAAHDQAAMGPTNGYAVLETMDGGGYTYIRVNDNGEDVWVAGPVTKLQVGDQVTFDNNMTMENFSSTSLDRTFDKIIFANSFSSASVKAPSGHNFSMDNHKVKSPVNMEVEIVEKVSGGVTIAELFADKSKYAGQTVKIRGYVVKFNADIMGKNWVHIQDGTRSGANFDLTATSKDIVEVGETVVLTGTVTADKDFGFGYKYDLLLENATITEE